MTRLIALAFAAVVSAGAVNVSAFAITGEPSAEPVRMCFDKFCDARGKCTYRPKPCPRGGLQQ